MKAVQIVQPYKLKIIEVPEPKIGPTDILIKVKALGLCGSDLKTYLGQNPMVSYPRIPGHEIGGEIIQTGSQVPDRFKPGLKITVSPYTACGECSACRIGRVNCCRDNQTMGIQRDGAAKEYITVPFQKIFLANNLSFEQIACIEPLSIGWHATNRAEVQKDEIVLVFGCGVIGLGAIIASNYKKARVIAVDIDDEKLKKAEKLGADITINSSRENLKEEINRITSLMGPQVVIEAVGHPDTYRACIDLVGYAGRVVYIGYSKQLVKYNTKFFVSKELDIRGSRNALDFEIREVIQMVSSANINFDCLVSQRFPMEKIDIALNFWSSNPQKVTKIIAYND
jgi:threonine dehydrogenase-like Zn-dependent dehydrogenase